MEVNCQVHGPAYLPPGTESRYPLDTTQKESWSERYGEQKILLPFPRIEPRLPSPYSCSYAAYAIPSADFNEFKSFNSSLSLLSEFVQNVVNADRIHITCGVLPYITQWEQLSRPTWVSSSHSFQVSCLRFHIPHWYWHSFTADTTLFIQNQSFYIYHISLSKKLFFRELR
jgi:hypothetical protein